jgi:Carboxypeptidase regulatory-like domain/TonB dependent receptor
MNLLRTLRRAGPAAILLAAFVLQPICTYAGTTGSLSGRVLNESGAAVAGAVVRVSSPSQNATATTDATGHFSFLTLSPDTYTATAEKSGYAATSTPGLTVFADQTLTVQLSLRHSLRTIANVTSQARGTLVQPGTTVDVYAVNAATAAQLTTGAGGNNLDSSYSAIYQQPGVLGLPGNYGFGQVFFIHGSSYNQIGYEFDGVPVNRSFDNYNANSLSNLGASSVEVYTGGGPANATSPTLGGYINQVIKTGTYPGYANITGGIGTPAYYHKAEVEAGGATPDRLFSWYVGIRGTNQIPYEFNDQNGGNLNADGDNAYGQQGYSFNTLLLPGEEFIGSSTRGPWSTCGGGGAVAPANGSYLSPLMAQLYGVSGKLNSCNVYSPLEANGTVALGGNELSDRENVINFHIGIPHKSDAGRDDVQLLYDNFFYKTTSFDNISTFGGLPFFQKFFSPAGNPNGTGAYNSFLENGFGIGLPPAQMPAYAGMCAYYNLFNVFGASPPCASSGQTPQPFFDGQQVINAKFGQSALGSPNIVSPYYFPSSPTDRPFQSGTSAYQNATTNNNGSIVKVQYTKNFGSSSFLRVFGYSFYSDWLMNDPNYSLTPFLVGGGSAGDYELNTHTRGLYLDYSNQINAQNLLSATANYTTASVLRDNNQQFTFSAFGTPIATLQGPNGNCYAAYANSQSGGLIDPGYSASLKAGAPVSCLSALAGAPVNAVQQGQTGCKAGKTFGCLQAIPAGAPSGTTWNLTQNLAQVANINTVSPKFLTAALQDEFRPSDKLDITAGVRFESYGYGLGDYSSASQQFWFSQVNQTVCVDPRGLQQVNQTDFDNGRTRYGPVPTGYPSYMTTAPGVACPVDPLSGDQLYHPGQHGVPAITLGGNGTITDTTFSPRFGFTYTINPDSVIRFSYGRYTQPTPTADEQVLTYPDGYLMATNLYDSSYYNNGFSSIVHNNPIQFSNNWDASFEQRLKGTDWSYKISPYYRYTSNQSVNVSLPGGLTGAFNSGTERTQGLEVAVQKGDASRNGFSGQLSYTYTYSQLKYSLINGTNIVSTLLSSLKPFLSLEKINGGSACYSDKTGNGVSCKQTNAVLNPYYDFKYTNAQLASEFPLTAFYPTYANFFPYGLNLGDASTIIPPNVFAGFLSYKHNRFQITATGNLWEGTQYGSPAEFSGFDPRSCLRNQGQIGVVPGSRLGDYQTCGSQIVVPNPVTAKFDGIAQYREPWEFNLGAQIGYDITPRIHATAQLANIFTQCFGGSAEPWTAAYAPNSVICGYFPNTSYLNWSPGEAYNTAGSGYFYGNSPHQAVNGTTGYPKLFDQAYVPGTSQIASPFQVFVTVQVRL